MKRLIKKTLAIFVALYPYSLYERFHRINMIRYSLWISRAFGSVGKNPHIRKPLQLKGAKYISVGDNFDAGYRNRIEAWDTYRGSNHKPNIIIGNNVCLNNDCHIGAVDRIEIGNNVLIGSRVLITDHNHGDTSPHSLSLPPSERSLVSKGAVIIGKNVWIGEGVVILSGVTIGESSIVGANSVVTQSIPANSVVAGIPARIIKKIDISNI